MTITWLDIALPICIAAIFAYTRYIAHVKAGVANPQLKATVDGINGAIGLTVITLAYKYFTSH